MISFLDDKLGGLFVFEWGAGGSTLWFAQRARRVISIEHDLEWYLKVVRQRPENASIYRHSFWPDYYEAIFGYYPDFVLIDGRRRKACAAACRLVQPPAILWDDAQRDYYQCSMHFDGYGHRDFLDTEHPRVSRLFVRTDGPLAHWLKE